MDINDISEVTPEKNQSPTGENAGAIKNQAWQCDKSLIEGMHYMFTNQIACDVSILVGPDKYEIRAHRLVLIARSPVFFDKLRPSSEEFPCKVNVPNVEVDTFLRFLGYMFYTILFICHLPIFQNLHCALLFSPNHRYDGTVFMGIQRYLPQTNFIFLIYEKRILKCMFI